jgi:F-type H+-transporting ATPase subunit b
MLNVFNLGPYVFAAGITTYVLSKEIWVVDHEFPYVLATIGMFYLGWKKFGKSVAEYLDKEIDVCNLCNLLYLLHYLY